MHSTRGRAYYIIQIFCRFTGSAAQTHCARCLQLVSKKFLKEEIFTGTNFRELAFDREIFYLAKFPAIRGIYIAVPSTYTGMHLMCMQYDYEYSQAFPSTIRSDGT